MTKKDQNPENAGKPAKRAPTRKPRVRRELLELRDLPSSFVPGDQVAARGRPRKIPTAEQVRQVERCAALGLAEADIAAVLGIDPGTFRQYKPTHFFAALEKGRAKGKMSAGIALARAMARGNVAAIIWFERTRCGYTERIEQLVTQTVSGPNGEPVNIGLFLPTNGRDVPALSGGSLDSHKQ